VACRAIDHDEVRAVRRLAELTGVALLATQVDRGQIAQGQGVDGSEEACLHAAQDAHRAGGRVEGEDVVGAIAVEVAHGGRGPGARGIGR